MTDRLDHIFLQPADFAASLAFYRDTLGWEVVARWGDETGGRGAVLSGGAIKVVLDERPARPVAPPGGPVVCLDIHDADRRFQALPAGAPVVSAPESLPDGSRRFVVRDPDGLLLAFEEASRHRG